MCPPKGDPTSKKPIPKVPPVAPPENTGLSAASPKPGESNKPTLPPAPTNVSGVGSSSASSGQGAIPPPLPPKPGEPIQPIQSSHVSQPPQRGGGRRRRKKQPNAVPNAGAGQPPQVPQGQPLQPPQPAQPVQPPQVGVPGGGAPDQPPQVPQGQPPQPPQAVPPAMPGVAPYVVGNAQVNPTMSRKRQLEYKFVLKADKNVSANIVESAEAHDNRPKDDKVDDDESYKADDVLKTLKSVTDMTSSVLGEKGLSFQDNAESEKEAKEEYEWKEKLKLKPDPKDKPNTDSLDKQKTIQGNLDISKHAFSATSDILDIAIHGVEGYRHFTKDKKLEKTKKAEYARGVASMLDLTTSFSEGAGEIYDAVIEGTGAKDSNELAAGFSSLFDVTTGLAKIGSNIANYAGNIHEKHAHDDIAAAAANFDDPADDAALNTERGKIANLSGGNADRLLSAQEQKDLKDYREKRRTLKAKRFAMKQASDLHKVKAENFKTGGLGYLLDGATALTTGFKGLGKIPFTNKAASNWISASGGIATSFLKGLKSMYDTYQKSDKAKNGEKAFARKKNEIVSDYIKASVDKLKAKASTWAPSAQENANLAQNDANDGEGTDNNLSDNEAKRLVLMRLGFYVKSNASVDNVSSDELFKRITEKRANQIMHAESQEKENMLVSLGFPRDKVDEVKFEEIYKVLSGETV